MSYCKILKAYFPATEMVYAFINKDKQDFVHKSLVAKCDVCGEYAIKAFGETDSNGKFIDDFCADEKDLIICDDCGCWVKEDDTTGVENSTKRVWNNCLAENYKECMGCGEYYRIYALYKDRANNYTCTDCLRDGTVVRCEHCEDFYLSEDICETTDHHYLCQWCYDNETHCCDRCCSVYYEDIVTYNSTQDEYWCEDCWDEAGETPEKTINDYSYKPAPNFLKLPEEKTKEFFGFEIEVEGNQIYANEFKQILGDTVYLKRDGSVDGFEIVTHPMTRQYFYQEFAPKLNEGMNLLKRSGFRAHNRAGIHIHISNEAITKEMLIRMIDVVYQHPKANQEIWRKITQRRSYELDRWASMKISHLCSGSKKATFESIKHYNPIDYEKPRISPTRYTAINTNNAKTTEFRIFNSNLRIERIIKNAQVVFSLIDFSKTKKKTSLKNYLNFVFDNEEEYKELCDFLIEKQIYNPRSVYDQLTLNLEPVDDDDNERMITCA